MFKYIFIITFIIFASCKKFVEPGSPRTQISSGEVFQNQESAEAAVRGIYANIMKVENLFSFYLMAYSGLASDELRSPQLASEFAANEVTTRNPENSSFWLHAYSLIYAANSIIEKLAVSPLPSSLRKRLDAEARFIRGYIYFHIAQLWGDAPLVTGTDYKLNSSLHRSDAASIMEQAKNDFTTAASSLPDEQPGRTRPSKFAALAMLARLSLYQENWSEAEAESSELINSGIYSLETDPSTVFKSFSNETIFQFSTVNPSYNTYDGKNFYTPDATIPAFALTSELMNSFESDDLRLSWTGRSVVDADTFYYPFKYREYSSETKSENYITIRLAEIYLIRAEARVNLGDDAGAADDLNLIRSRAGLLPLTGDVMDAVREEGRHELFAEMGHRWFDLKRWKLADEVLAPIKPGWKNTDVYWPVPQQEISLNPNLDQNPGY